MASKTNGIDASKPGDTIVNYSRIIFFIFGHLAAFYAVYLGTTRPVLNIYTCYLFVTLYVLTTFSITAGYHRLYAHGAFRANSLFKLFVLLFGSSAFLGNTINWCRYHRAHHRFHGKPLDPMNSSKGFFHAHMGWLFVHHTDATYSAKVDVSDIEKDPWATFQAKLYFPIACLVGLVCPAILANLWNDAAVRQLSLGFIAKAFVKPKRHWIRSSSTDFIQGGLFIAGFLRIVCVQHAIFSTTSFAHLLGTRKYSDDARNNFLVSIFSLGEGYQNFHHNFPKDYRVGPKFYDFDPTKWGIYVLSLLGIVYDLKETKMIDVKKAHLLYKQQLLDKKKAKLDFGPEEKDLPIENWESVAARVKQGAKLLVIDGLIHDATQFIRIHPGGIKILERRIGKDCTIGFNGGLYRHSKAARNILATLRVAKLPPEEVNLRTESDHFRGDDE